MRPTTSGYVTLEFGVQGDRWFAGYHTGRDYRAATGDKVLATFRGQVKTIGQNESYGLYVSVLSDTPGMPAVQHRYCHLSAVSVKDESFVNPGQEIGRSGNSGNTTAAHLHYEERLSPFYYADHRNPALDRLAWKNLDMSQISESFRREPNSSGLTLYPANTKLVQEGLRHEGLWFAETLDGHVSYRLRDGYKTWEKEQGWTPTGVPSYEGMLRLGRRWGFTVSA